MAPSLELLQLLHATHAFDPVAIPGYRGALYVPFERLVGGRLETALEAELANDQRVALIGPIGCGKSSMVEYVMSARQSQFAPIWVSAAHEGPAMLMDPPEFARHLIRQIVSWAREAREMSSDEHRAFLLETSETLPGRTVSSRQEVSLKFGLHWIEPKWGREIEETLPDPEVARNRGDFIASLGRLVELIREDLGRTPVVIIDDSDRWLSLEVAQRDDLISAFFTDTCRMLAEVNWAMVMAVHPEYCGPRPFRDAVANGFFNVQMDAPRIDRPEALRELLDVRVRILAENAEDEALLEAGIDPALLPNRAGSSVDDVFEAGFDSVLLEYYAARDRFLRGVLTVAQQAVQETIALGEAIVPAATVREVALAHAP